MYDKGELSSHLVTKAEYDLLPPCDQGFVIYAQANSPGSELAKHKENPYKTNSLNWRAWNRGQWIAALEVQLPLFEEVKL